MYLIICSTVFYLVFTNSHVTSSLLVSNKVLLLNWYEIIWLNTAKNADSIAFGQAI